MKKIFKKSNIFVFILGALIFSGITAVSAYTIFANDIGYTPKNTTWKKSDGTDITNVKEAIDELYTKVNSNNNQTVCMLLSGTKNTVSSKYHCDLGDGELRNFYVLKVNSNDVELIMEKNITDEVLINNSRMLSWNDAMTFFDENEPGYTLRETWLTKVKEVKLPDAQTIADAGGITGFGEIHNYFFGGSTSTRRNYAWLYNYTGNCVSAGNCTNEYPNSAEYPKAYWTKDLGTDDYAWTVDTNGQMAVQLVSRVDRCGIRPVITVLKSNLKG